MIRLRLITVALLLIISMGALAQDQQSEANAAKQHVDKGNTLYDRGEYEKARAEYEEAIKLAPNSWEPHYELGQTLGMLKQLPGAEAELKKSVELKADCWLCFTALGNMADDAGTPEKALAFYDQAIAASASSAKPHYNKAITLLRLKRTDDGIQELITAEKIDPKYASPYFLLGQVYYRLGKLFPAQDQLFKATKLETSGKRYEQAKKLIDVNITIDNTLAESKSAGHMAYCIVRAGEFTESGYRKRFPNADTYVPDLQEELEVLRLVVTILGEAKKSNNSDFADLLKINKAGYLAPFVLTYSGDRLAKDRDKYEAENPGRMAEFVAWAKNNGVSLERPRFRCEVAWMGQTW